MKAIDSKPKVKAKGKKKDKFEQILSKAASNLVISTNFKKNETKAQSQMVVDETSKESNCAKVVNVTACSTAEGSLKLTSAD